MKSKFQSPLFEQIKPSLISLGFSFYGEASLLPADPENTLLAGLEFFYEDRKLFRMLLRWCLSTSSLIHVERLSKLAQKLDPALMPALEGLALKLVKAGDRRFKLIVDQMKASIKKHAIRLPEGYADPYLIAKQGIDPEFLEVGFTMALIQPEDQKKILGLCDILKMNHWLKIRALVGANFRADLIFLLIQKKVKNPNQAAKILCCSRETAYRLWREISLFEGIEKLAA